MREVPLNALEEDLRAHPVDITPQVDECVPQNTDVAYLELFLERSLAGFNRGEHV